MNKINNKIEITLANINDLKDIHQILVGRCIWLNDHGIKQWNQNNYPKKYSINYFSEQMKINKLFVAKDNKSVVGVMLLKNEDKTYWQDDKQAYYIHHLATNSNYKGIGIELIKFAIKEAKLNNKDYLRLDCVKSNLKLNNYYKLLGFKIVGFGKYGSYYYNLLELKIEVM